MIERKVSARFARAFLETAQEENQTDQVLHDLQVVRAVVDKSREIQSLLKSPIVRGYKKKSIMDQIFKEHVSELTMKFLTLLIDKNREDLVDSIIAEYEEFYNELNNRLPVTIVSAVELNDELKNHIEKKLHELTQKTIVPEYKIDETVKGGLQIYIQDWVFDATVKSQLETLYHSLAGNNGVSG